MSEKRKHVRFEPKGVLANIIISPPSPHNIILLQGVVVDISYSGIKIKLSCAIPVNIPPSKIKINLILHKLAFPIVIKGLIRYVNPWFEMGFKFAEDNAKHEIDDLLFECIKMIKPVLPRATKH